MRNGGNCRNKYLPGTDELRTFLQRRSENEKKELRTRKAEVNIMYVGDTELKQRFWASSDTSEGPDAKWNV